MKSIKVDVVYTLRQEIYIQVDEEDNVEEILKDNALDFLTDFGFKILDLDYELEEISKEEAEYMFNEEDYRQGDF